MPVLLLLLLLLLLLAATVRRVTAPFPLKHRAYLLFVTVPLPIFCFAILPHTFTCQHCETSGNTSSLLALLQLVGEMDNMLRC
jgi:hypothetical protein